MALLALSAACAVGPNYRRPDAPTAPAYKEDQGWKPAMPAQIAADEPWWSIYDDPLLDGLERQVEVSNQNLKAAEAAYRSAESRSAWTAARCSPDFGQRRRHAQRRRHGFNQAITTSSGTTVPRTGGNGIATLYSAGAQASWPIDVWGRIRRPVESDVAKAQASAADVAAARLSAQITLAEDYFQLRAADEQMRLYRPIDDFNNA